jgi:predicted RNA-binding protein with PUA-like domain
MNYWLVKTEPGTYSWDDFVKLGRDHWDGVRNYQARNNLKLMKNGDEVLFYHSVNAKEIVGIAKVVTEFYQDPTTNDDRWVVVDLEPVRKLAKPVSLAHIKADQNLADLALVKHTRLSVMPVDQAHYELILSKSI